MKVVTILIPSFHGLYKQLLGARPPFCVLTTKKKYGVQIMTLGATQPRVINPIQSDLLHSMRQEGADPANGSFMYT